MIAILQKGCNLQTITICRKIYQKIMQYTQNLKVNKEKGIQIVRKLREKWFI